MTFPHRGVVDYLVMELRRRYQRARLAEDAGASVIEWVIITGVLVLLAGVVGTVIYNLANDAADAIEMPDAPGGP